MIKIPRKEIQEVKGVLFNALKRATTNEGLRIHVPSPTDDQLEKAVMLCLHSLAVDVLGVNEIVVPSDVGHHISGFGLGSAQ